MVCHEVREVGRRTSRRVPSGHPACRPRRCRRSFFDAGMRPVCNACSGEPDEFPDHEVNAHLRYPGSGIGERSGVELPAGPTHAHSLRETRSARSTPKGWH